MLRAPGGTASNATLSCVQRAGQAPSAEEILPLVIQAVKGFSRKTRKQRFIVYAIKKEQCSQETLLHFQVKAMPCKWRNCCCEGGAAYGFLCYSALVAFVSWPRDLCCRTQVCRATLGMQHSTALGLGR